MKKKQLRLILNLSQPYAADELIYCHLSGSKEASVDILTNHKQLFQQNKYGTIRFVIDQKM